MSLPKGLAWKLIPKFIRPYLITKDFGDNLYCLELSSELKKQGIHDIFHLLLLQIHEPNDDCLLDSQVAELEDNAREWAINHIISHSSSRENALFKVLWKSGDKMWVPSFDITALSAVAAYLELQGVEWLADLAIGTGKPPSNEPQISLGALQIMNEKTIKEGLSSTEVLQLLTQFSIAIQASIYSTSIVVISSK